VRHDVVAHGGGGQDASALASLAQGLAGQLAGPESAPSGCVVPAAPGLGVTATGIVLTVCF